MLGTYICVIVAGPILFIWGRVGFGLLAGLFRELRAPGPPPEPDLQARLKVAAARPADEARALAERALGGLVPAFPRDGAAPRWTAPFHPEIRALFERYERIGAAPIGTLGGSAAGSPAFLEGHHILGPANAAGDRWWVARPGAAEIVLSEESALGAEVLGTLPSVWHVIAWQADEAGRAPQPTSAS